MIRAIMSAQATATTAIDSFIDAIWLEDGLSRNTLAAYRRDLGIYAGWLGVTFGMSVTFVVLGVSGALAVWATLTVWPAIDPEVIEHEHPELPAGHDHTRGAVANRGGVRHAHRFVVDDHHPHWPNMVR